MESSLEPQTALSTSVDARDALPNRVASFVFGGVYEMVECSPPCVHDRQGPDGVLTVSELSELFAQDVDEIGEIAGGFHAGAPALRAQERRDILAARAEVSLNVACREVDDEVHAPELGQAAKCGKGEGL